MPGRAASDSHQTFCCDCTICNCYVFFFFFASLFLLLEILLYLQIHGLIPFITHTSITWQLFINGDSFAFGEYVLTSLIGTEKDMKISIHKQILLLQLCRYPVKQPEGISRFIQLILLCSCVWGRCSKPYWRCGRLHPSVHWCCAWCMTCGGWSHAPTPTSPASSRTNLLTPLSCRLLGHLW